MHIVGKDMDHVYPESVRRETMKNHDKIENPDKQM
jgi:hypothetical protein